LAAGTLPAGLNLNPATGAISGTPTGSGSASLTFRVTDLLGQVATASPVTLTVNGMSQTISFTQPANVTLPAQPITLTASAGQQALPASAWRLFDRSGTAWSLIFGLTAPIFDGGTLRADRRAAIDELRASSERYQQTVLESFGQVADVLDALSQDAGNLGAQTRALSAAQSSLDLSRESYRAGNTGILQVLDAQRQRQQARLGFVRAQAQQYLDTTQLFLALGGSSP